MPRGRNRALPGPVRVEVFGAKELWSESSIQGLSPMGNDHSASDRRQAARLFGPDSEPDESRNGSAACRQKRFKNAPPVKARRKDAAVRTRPERVVSERFVRRRRAEECRAALQYRYPSSTWSERTGAPHMRGADRLKPATRVRAHNPRSGNRRKNGFRQRPDGAAKFNRFGKTCPRSAASGSGRTG